MIAETEQLAGTFLFRVWVTRGCYFALSDRLRRKARYSVASVTMLSFYVTALSIMQLGYPQALGQSYLDLVPALTLILSVLIIIVTLLENSKEYRLEAEYSLQTAQKLLNLYGRCELRETGMIDENEVDLRKEYGEIMISARTTRRTIDYLWFQFDNPQQFKAGRGRKAVLFLGLIWNGTIEYWIYAAMILIPPLLAIIALT